MSALETLPNWDRLSEADKAEVKRFEAFLKAKAVAEEGLAVEAPELLYACVFGLAGETPEVA